MLLSKSNCLKYFIIFVFIIKLVSALPVDHYNLTQDVNKIFVVSKDFYGNLTDFDNIVVKGQNFTYDIIRTDIGQYQIPLFFNSSGIYNISINLISYPKNFTEYLSFDNEALKFPKNIYVWANKTVSNFYNNNKDKLVDYGIIVLIIIFLIIVILFILDVNSRRKKHANTKNE